MAAGDFEQDGMVQILAAIEGAISLHRHTQTTTCGDQGTPVPERVELDLVDGRRLERRVADRLQLTGIEVTDADRSSEAAGESPLHARPGLGRTAKRPVDEIQVEALDPKPFDATVEPPPRDRVPRGGTWS